MSPMTLKSIPTLRCSSFSRGIQAAGMRLIILLELRALPIPRPAIPEDQPSSSASLG